MECHCEKCGMGVKNLVCSRCDRLLVNNTITTSNGQNVRVAMCPNGCGQIKSPVCCGQDMTCIA
jgi:hypothetical protein